MAPAALKVLVVDDDPAFRERLLAMLGEVSAGAVAIECVTNIADAEERLNTHPFDLCLLDYQMGEVCGIELLRRVQRHHLRTAFIFLAEQARKDWCYAALHHGAMDYLIRGKLDSFGLTKSIAFSLFRKSKEWELQGMALRDPLTGVGNRTLFAEQAETLIRLAQRTRERIGVLFMDVDGLKPVNDSHGHAVGDELLRSVSKRLGERLRKGDIVARMVGDEFAALLVAVDDRQTVIRVAREVSEAVARPYQIEGREVRIGISCGTALFPEDSSDIDDLVRLADRRMYDAKLRKKADVARPEMSWFPTPLAAR